MSAETTPNAEAENQTESAPEAEPKAEEAKADPAAEVARMRDQLLRTAADFDNFRKRARREQDDAHKRGQQQVLKDLLPVFDNLERAAQHADTATDVKPVAEGVRMVIKQFEGALEKLGIKRIPSVGMPFDPAVHEAIQHVESPDQPAGVVLHEVQPGYAWGDLLLRASMVVVSKGPAKGEVLPS
ncbi:MAG: nucleotide exchange factor GrpE [Polyangiaceae bacterium]